MAIMCINVEPSCMGLSVSGVILDAAAIILESVSVRCSYGVERLSVLSKVKNTYAIGAF